ncbi:MAG TPA: LysR family transcriptional regulator [Gemmatimonadaceae bacterium]|jgi:DNA-binding transcriptional LysR family regulator|nr:LysR family transcriptional regulator [Gemmatimonadaceae bacterium]
MPLSEARLSPELPYLEVFYAVCSEGGFTAAADRLGRTQPAISYQVRSLERVLGTKLIERGGRRVLLTPAGERLRSFCHEFFGELVRVRSECAGGHRPDPLRLGSASGFGRYVLVPALHRLAELRARHREPALAPHVAFDSADVVVARLERGECDAAFVYNRRITNHLRYRAVYDEELVLISPARRRGRKAPDLTTLDVFERSPFVTYQEGDYVFGRWFDANFGDQPATLQSVAHFSELEEVIDFVRREAGLSIVPRDSVRAACARGEVEIVYAGRGAPCLNQVYMVVRSGSTTSKDIQQLVEVLKAISTSAPA